MNVEVLAKLISTIAAQRLFFDAITALVAGMLGAIALRLGSRALQEERWIQYFGSGFVIFAVQYAVPTVVGLSALLDMPLSIPFAPASVEWFQRLASGANNVVFLAAGLALWRPGWRPRLRYWILASLAALASVSADWAGWLAPWHRSLDGVFSALAAGSLGLAFYVMASPRRRWWLLAVASSGALLYAFLSLAFAAAPAFAVGEVWPDLAYGISDALGAPPGQLHPQLGADLDAFLIAIAFFLKALLAIGGFALILRALVLISPRELGKVLEGVSRGDLDYFSGDGIVRAIGGSLSADRATIYSRLPGVSARKISQWAWPDRHDLAPVVPLPPGDDGREGEVLASGRTLSNPIWEASPAAGWSWLRRWRAHSLVATPVLFQGTVIGCLTVEWHRPHGFTKTAVQLAERLAEMLGPTIESRRKLEALVFWSRRLQELKVETTPPGYRNLARILASLVHETLSPLSVSLALKVGFAPVWAAAGDGGERSGFPDDLPFGGLEQVLRQLGKEHSTRIQNTEIKFGATPIGTLTILWPEIKPPLIRPLIRSDALHLQSITPLIANIVLRLGDADFSRMLSDLQVDLAAAQRLEEWSAVIVSMVCRAGPIWVLAELEGGELHGNGPPELVKKQSAQAEGQGSIWHRRLEEPQAGTHHVVRLLLKKSQARLWLGVSNSELEPELESAWPWRSFLERLAEAADASLSSLSTSAELHKVRKEAGQIQGLLKSTVDTGAFIHEMRNIARSFKFAAQSLDKARRRGELTTSLDIEKDILSMQRSAERLYGMADAVLKPSALDGRLVYPLDELVHEVHDLFEPILKQHRVGFLEDVPRDLEVATPSYAVHLALVSLVSNSIDAIQLNGTIRVVGELPRNGTVVCHVIDSGPGIQLPEPESVFDLGTSTKTGTGGKGLFMIRQLLSGVGAEIHLTDPAPRQTTFTIKLRHAHRKD